MKLTEVESLRRIGPKHTTKIVSGCRGRNAGKDIEFWNREFRWITLPRSDDTLRVTS